MSPLNDLSEHDSRVWDPFGPGAVGADTHSNVELSVDGDHAVEWLSGEIDVANSTRVLHVGRQAVSDCAVQSLVVDLSRVTFLDSTGLGVLIQLRRAATVAGKRLALRGVTPAIAKIFRLTRLDEVFGLTVEDAGRC